MKPSKPTKQLLKRLNVYLDYLKSLPESVTSISATSIARALALGDVQVRKDLAKASDGGQRRVGHNRARLIRDIESYLDLSTVTKAVLVFSGKLGAALLDFTEFEKYGLQLQAGFNLHGTAEPDRTGCPVYPIGALKEYCTAHSIHIGMIAVPAESAQEACDLLIGCGIRAIWNFSSALVSAPKSVAVHNSNLTVSATALRIQLQEQQYKNT